MKDILGKEFRENGLVAIAMCEYINIGIINHINENSIHVSLITVDHTFEKIFFKPFNNLICIDQFNLNPSDKYHRLIIKEIKQR